MAAPRSKCVAGAVEPTVRRAPQWRLALGARVELVPQPGGPRPGQVSAEDLAVVQRRTAELVEELGAFLGDQFNNPSAMAIDADGNLWIETEDAYKMVRRLAREEGLLVGISSGAAIAGCVQVARRPDPREEAVIVTIFPDSGDKYLSERFWTEG